MYVITDNKLMTYLVTRKFGRTAIDKLILTVYQVFQHKPCLRGLKVQECPNDFLQLERPTHYCRIHRFCLNFRNH